MLLVRSSEAPEVRDGNPKGYYYDFSIVVLLDGEENHIERRTEGPFRTQIDMIDHAQKNAVLKENGWRWFIPGHDDRKEMRG